MGGAAEAGGAAGAAGAGLVAIPIAATLYGAFDVLTDGTATFHKEAFDAYAGIKSNAAALEAELSMLSETIYLNVAPGIREVADLYGVTLLQGLHGMSEAALFAAKHTDMATSALSAMSNSPLMKMLLDYGMRHRATEDTVSVDRNADLATAMGGGVATLAFGLAEREKERKPKTGGGHGGGGTTIGRIEITVSSNADPARVARLVRTELEAELRHPKKASGVRDWSKG